MTLETTTDFNPTTQAVAVTKSANRVCYTHPTVNGRRLTVAYQLISSTQAVFGVAFCGPEDDFTRKIGRSIATGRMERNGHCVQVPNPDEQGALRTILASITAAAYDNTDTSVPSWAVLSDVA